MNSHIINVWTCNRLKIKFYIITISYWWGCRDYVAPKRPIDFNEIVRPHTHTWNIMIEHYADLSSSNVIWKGLLRQWRSVLHNEAISSLPYNLKRTSRDCMVKYWRILCEENPLLRVNRFIIRPNHLSHLWLTAILHCLRALVLLPLSELSDKNHAHGVHGWYTGTEKIRAAHKQFQALGSARVRLHGGVQGDVGRGRTWSHPVVQVGEGVASWTGRSEVLVVAVSGNASTPLLTRWLWLLALFVKSLFFVLCWHY